MTRRRAVRRRRVDDLDRGQAAVEVALALPLVVVMVLGFVQVIVIVGDRLAVELAAREGARAAAVAADTVGAADAAARRSTHVGPLDVDVSATPTLVSVTVRHRSPTDVPLIGRFIGDVDVAATITMAREPP